MHNTIIKAKNKGAKPLWVPLWEGGECRTRLSL
jgi:hypothetical protein